MREILPNNIAFKTFGKFCDVEKKPLRVSPKICKNTCIPVCLYITFWKVYKKFVANVVIFFMCGCEVRL
eukprot:TRINITY_DN14717_c0_g1_i1.p1 TRINITY_DN14717_c0_g1~~TRINITY_DN14717_c0_g1_i1.p1  ORF type:complete len:69 (-),score=6.56 TRINITY_DN14717_c0_g1_i1:205-411(-)